MVKSVVSCAHQNRVRISVLASSVTLGSVPPEGLGALACPVEMRNSQAFLFSVQLDARISGPQNSVGCFFPYEV